ncbi:gap junction delta-2 protein isoform X1 [Fukomys damarensis]|nr:gap junction delta-2 protein isoform X1 [Fukomys damarensis]XP_033620920.1 gap junction delta-2 protein isoform X1 [Fukomys damarensis]
MLQPETTLLRPSHPGSGPSESQTAISISAPLSLKSSLPQLASPSRKGISVVSPKAEAKGEGCTAISCPLTPFPIRPRICSGLPFLPRGAGSQAIRSQPGGAARGGARSGNVPGAAQSLSAASGCPAMGEWTILERLLEAAVQQHSTMIGRILLTVVVIFRILIVAIVGETVYDDEQTMFVCNTLQPGCNQACYDRAFPISHIRYWVFQIIMVCTPSLCFITYSVHQSAKQRERRYSTVFLALDRDTPEAMGGPGGTGGGSSGGGKREDKKLQNAIVNGVLQNTENTSKETEPDCLEVKELTPHPSGLRTAARSKLRRQEGISRFYIIQVVFRNALEIGFLVGQYFLYGFSVPGLYECNRYPCIKEVECYVSRPTEKTVFLVFMFAVSGICVVLNLAELNHLGWRKIKLAVRGAQAKRKSVYEIRNKDLPRVSVPNFGRTQSSDSAYV